MAKTGIFEHFLGQKQPKTYDIICRRKAKNSQNREKLQKTDFLTRSKQGTKSIHKTIEIGKQFQTI
ncbi:MAG: hypothetical protein J6T48_07745 [Bacteroidales bacterium]|nr:hypothetical protein [Bacteroidales bacterium]